MDVWMDISIGLDGLMHGYKNTCMCRVLNGCMHGWMEGLVRWMDAWMYE